MMKDAGCSDANLYKDLANGIALVGELPKSGEWPDDHRPSAVKPEALNAMSGAIRRRIALMTT
eukprot:3927294-Amphidinium_carterae.1